jgi:septal ring factor EnvC (AmiA/AmiB activator)
MAASPVAALQAGPAATVPAPQAADARPGSGDEEAVRRAEARAAELRREAEALSARERTLLTELRALEVASRLRAADLERAVAETEAAEAALIVAEARAATLDRDVGAARPRVAARLRRLYTRGRFDAEVRLLAASSVRDAARTARLLSMLAARDQQRIASFERDARALRLERAAIEARTRDAQQLRLRAQAARDEAARAAGAHARRLGEVAASRELAERFARELSEAQAALQARLKETLNPAARSQLVLPIAPFRGALAWPATGPVVRAFGRARETRFGTAIVRNGIEIGAAEGQPVRAIHEGRVAFADTFIGFGRLIIVDHGQAALSLYGHLGETAVQRGDRVAAGTAIGTAGRSPAGAPALYFELRIDGRPVDPLQWLKPRSASSP